MQTCYEYWYHTQPSSTKVEDENKELSTKDLYKSETCTLKLKYLNKLIQKDSLSLSFLARELHIFGRASTKN